MMRGVLRIANASGFYGDRFAAVHEMLTGGEIDVLTGDYLAELTMLILARDRLRAPEAGYARTFLAQMEGSLGEAVDRGVRIVVNAGGLNPAGLATELRALAERLGVTVTVAHVEGDDLLARAGELGFGSPLAANAYLGAWGIVAALDAGADVVVTGRVTDASLVVGPAAAHFGWSRTDHDRIAGAMVAGHVIECGTQATGGNFSGFRAIADLSRPGFPIAEIAPDGTAVITKHPDTPGAVTRDTVTAQLLYEIGSPRYAGPDATARFDTITLDDDGEDRVRISGVVGEPPPPTCKVGLNHLAGYRNEVTFVLTGLDIDAKADLVRAQMDAAVDVDITWTLARTDRPDADTEQTASALLQAVVRSDDQHAVGRAFTSAAIELALAGYPGFHVTAPPSKATPYGVFTAAFLPQDAVGHIAVLAEGTRIDVAPPPEVLDLVDPPDPAPPDRPAVSATRRAALGSVVHARSGDKGGDANIGVWVTDPAAWPWLVHTLTVERLRTLLPETADLPVTRHVLANLGALNFVIEGILGEGVASNARFDPQAKALGEWLRSRHLDVPEAFT